ncbi:hypothetical protein BJ980_002585 [Nocardioides daedukensis]|uniref:HIT domain-containing protein n=1 Tax=Nocardioides daedukensis TaxID=634462 RepID=A0A7Y9RZT9_9ACTN|nr:hypothetical protein [Nocardioides daedukensis]NYG59662.1 hypothetical protein [Nocardioides daedukensis]
MPESPEVIHARVAAAVGPDGRLPMPPVADWETFPWELVDGELMPKVLPEPVAAEEPREGRDGVDCKLCDEGESDPQRIWESWNFHVKAPAAPSGFPLVLWLNSNDHLDFTELDDTQAAEFGQLSVILTRIMSNMEHIGRVHMSRWGDGAEHMHAWFLARPARFPMIRGSMALEWDAMLPPGPEPVWRADLATVARKLATHGGRALV